MNPRKICVTKDNYLIITDSDNNRLQVFDSRVSLRVLTIRVLTIRVLTMRVLTIRVLTIRVLTIRELTISSRVS